MTSPLEKTQSERQGAHEPGRTPEGAHSVSVEWIPGSVLTSCSQAAALGAALLLDLRHLLLQLLHPGQEVPHAACQLTVLWRLQANVVPEDNILFLDLLWGQERSPITTKGLGVSLHLDRGGLGHVNLVGVADSDLLLLLAASRRLESGWGRGRQEHRAQQEPQGEAELPLETHPWGDGEPMLLEACIQKNMQKKARDICWWKLAFFNGF